jgi:hypothetical protein
MTAVGYFVMPGLVPGIHDLEPLHSKDMDHRVKPGGDEEERW